MCSFHMLLVAIAASQRLRSCTSSQLLLKLISLIDYEFPLSLIISLAKHSKIDELSASTEVQKTVFPL